MEGHSSAAIGGLTMDIVLTIFVRSRTRYRETQLATIVLARFVWDETDVVLMSAA